MIAIHLKAQRDHQLHVVADEQGLAMLRDLADPARPEANLYHGLPIYRHGDCPCNRLKEMQ